MNPNAASAAVQQYGGLPVGHVWVDQPGAASIYYPKNILDFEGMTSMDYLANFKGRIKNVLDGGRFDTMRVTAGATVLKGEYKFFQLPIGELTATIDTGATPYRKDENDTDMLQSGQMEKDTALVVDSLQIDVTLPHRDFNLLAVGEPTSFVPSGTDTLSASNTLVGIQRTCRFEFNKKRDLLAKGRLKQFPPEGGFSGILGGATSEGIVQNGFGFRKPMREIVVLGGNYLFDVTLFVDVDIVFPYATEIHVNLAGLEIEGIGGL